MSKRVGVLILVLVFILTNSGLLLAAPQNEVSKNVITEIRVVGNKLIEDKEILNQIQTEVGDKISNQQLQNDMQSIFDLGYFFDIQVSFKNYQDGVMLIFEVIENPKLSEIKIIGNQEVSTNKLKEILAVKVNQILNVNQLDKSIKEINKYYQKQGYVLAKVVDVTIKDRDKLHVTINEGKLNKILISGNNVTKDYVIRRELSMKPGQTFNIEQMWKDLRKIYNLGYFKDVKPKFNQVKDNPQAVNLEINVKEQKTGTFSVGGGFNSSTGWTGLVNIEKDNIFGNGQKVKLNLEFGGKKQNYELGFYEPWAFGTETSLNFNLYNTTTKDSNDQDLNEKGADITVGRPLTENTKAYLKLNYDNTKYYEQVGEDPKNENTRSVTLKTIRDTRDDIFNPNQGSRQELSIEKAGFGGDSNFAKYQADLRKYLPVSEKSRWALRLKLGASNGELPGFEKYTLRDGLLDGVRGYKDEHYAGTEGFEGDSVLLSNIEYRFDVVDNVTGIAFADAGRTFEENKLSLNNLNYSMGLGARFNTPLGQIGLDYGYAPAGDKDNKTSLSFRIGNTF